MRSVLLLAVAIALGAAPFAASAQRAGGCGHCGKGHGGAASASGGHSSHGGPQAAREGDSHAAHAADAHEIAVTSDGFVPSSIRVKRGEPVKLVVTRKTDRTCAKDIVIEGYAIREPLPLDEPVTIEFTPAKSGEIRYACAMNMVSGVLLVE